MRRTFQELFKNVNNSLNEEEWVTPHHIAKKTGLDIRTVYRLLKKWNWASHENFKVWAIKPWWVGSPKIELAHDSKRIFAVKKLKEKIEG